MLRLRVMVLSYGMLSAALPLFPVPAPLSTQDALMAQADQLEQDGRLRDALRIYDHLIQTGSGRDLRWTAHLFFRQACLQAQLGDRSTALETAEAAVTLDPGEPAYKAFLSDLQTRSGSRHLSIVYRARRDIGSARRLTGRSGVLHVLVRGRGTDAWDADSVSKLQARIQEADRWLIAKAAEEGLSPAPVIDHRFWAMPEELFWRRHDIPDAQSPKGYREAWLEEVLIRLQARSFAEAFDRAYEAADVDHRSIVFHVSRRQDSFTTMTPYVPTPTDLEGVFAVSEESDWLQPYDAVAYVHEWLHVYGADDLFSKAKDPVAPESDVMHFGAHELSGCTLGPLTRYAIGWTDEVPALTRLTLAGRPKRSPATRTVIKSRSGG